MSELSRSKAVLTLRPETPNAIITPNTSKNEQFQNICLRPILKLQHEVFIEFTKHYIAKINPKFYELSAEKREVFIRTSLAKNATLKQQLIGTVTGQMTLEELKHFLENQSEYTKRIGQMITNRIVNSMHELEIRD